MPVDRTRLKFNLFNRKRARHFPDVDDLLILKRSTEVAASFELVATISDGWCAGLVTDPTIGPASFNFEIAEGDTDYTETFNDSISFLKTGDDAYEFQGVEKPTGALRVWVVRCSPTAVAITL